MHIFPRKTFPDGSVMFKDPEALTTQARIVGKNIANAGAKVVAEASRKVAQSAADKSSFVVKAANRVAEKADAVAEKTANAAWIESTIEISDWDGSKG